MKEKWPSKPQNFLQMHHHDDLGSKCAYTCHLSNKTTRKSVLLRYGLWKWVNNWPESGNGGWHYRAGHKFKHHFDWSRYISGRKWLNIFQMYHKARQQTIKQSVSETKSSSKLLLEWFKLKWRLLINSTDATLTSDDLSVTNSTHLHSEPPKQDWRFLKISLTKAFSGILWKEKCWSEVKQQLSFKYFVNFCLFLKLFLKVWE